MARKSPAKAVVQEPGVDLIVHEGRVIIYEQWVRWNGQIWNTVRIEWFRHDHKTPFKSDISDPEHGGQPKKGTLSQVLQVLHPEVEAKIKAIFCLVNLIPADFTKIEMLKGCRPHFV